MSAGKSNREVEIKLRISAPGEARRMLRRAGFRVSRRRVFESNVLFDTPGGDLRAGGQILRVRRVRTKAILTYKGPPRRGRHKSREELELRLSDGKRFGEVLERLGMKPAFRYEKYRTEYARPGGDGTVMVDETPIGNFLELEGAPRWIDQTARELGFGKEDYITADYGRLFLERVRESGSRKINMIFGDAGAD